MATKEALSALSVLSDMGGGDYDIFDFFALNVCTGDKFDFDGHEAVIVEAFTDEEANHYEYAATTISVGCGDAEQRITLMWDKVEDSYEWPFSGFN